jgi:hypothetical protein
MLALIWVTKYYRCYLRGRKFVVRSDHAALTYLHKFYDQNAWLIRWSLKLSEFDFTVEHRPGKKIPHADALSRHVGAILKGHRLDKQMVRQEQAVDDYCQSIKRAILLVNLSSLWT